MQSNRSQQAFLPNFCAIRMVFAVVLSTELLAFVLTLATYVAPEEFWQALSVRSMYLQWVALSAIAIFCGLRKPLNRLNHTQAGIVAWSIIMLVSTLVFLIIKNWIWFELVWQTLIYNLGMTAIIAALLLRYLYEQHRENERKLAESTARFQALQARIRPHFLFNSMNTIANLTQVNPDLAEEVVQDLSDLFRASLSDAQQNSSLGKELELARGYLRIEQQRLGDRLSVNWDLEAVPEHAPMPSLMLQPLLENAIYHGIEPAVQGGSINITARYRRDVVNISIVNSLPEQNQNAVRKGNQIALQNVRERMQQAYGEAADVRVGQVDEQYQARLFFPYQEEA